MKKKPKLLNTLLSGEKRRHHVAAFVTQEADWNQHEPNTGFARMFIAMLILHVLIIGGIILSDSSSGTKAPKSPAAQALLTKSSHEISSAPRQFGAKIPDTDADGVKYETYEVRSGDSLPMIVARFGVDRDELISLNRLDTDTGFSAGTVLKIPNNKINSPLQISPASPVKPAEVVDSSTVSPAEPASVSSTPETSSASTPPSATTSAPSSFVAMAPGADSTTGLVPLPDVTSASTTASVPSPAETTVVEAPSIADTPPAAESAPVVSKSDSVAVTPEPKKPAVKKAAPANTTPKSRPVPVPPPSEMKKRPIAKADSKADSPPKTETKGKTDAAKPAGKNGAHTLAKGETLYRLSAKYGVSIDSLIKANSIKDPAKLRDGTKLVIPAK